MPATDEALLVRAAELYYEENKTQDEIGTLLRLTRWKVGRLLTTAREKGIVRIEIVRPRARRCDLERALVEQFGLADVVVISGVGLEQLQEEVAAATAEYLTALRPVPRTLGVSWGRTIDSVATALPHGWATGVGVVQVNGGFSHSRRGNDAAAAVVMIATKAGGSATTLPIPAILEQSATRAMLEADRTIAGVLAQAESAAAYLFSVGVADGDSVLVQSGYLSTRDVAGLVRQGAVGDILGRYINSSGVIVDAELDDRTVGLRLGRIRSAATAIAVIAGAAKHRIAHAVVSAGLCTILITDEATAVSILSQNQQEESP